MEKGIIKNGEMTTRDVTNQDLFSFLIFRHQVGNYPMGSKSDSALYLNAKWEEIPEGVWYNT